MLSGVTSDSTVQSQVWRGRPDLRFQSLGKGVTLDLSARLWSIDVAKALEKYGTDDVREWWLVTVHGHCYIRLLYRVVSLRRWTSNSAKLAAAAILSGSI